MPFPRSIARFNRAVTNRIAKPLSGRIGPSVMLRHTGRKSGKPYETPVFAFKDGNRFVFALTYGPEADWVKNVLAAGYCSIRYRGEVYSLVEPELVHGPASEQPLPVPIRLVLGATGITHYLSARIAS